VNESRRKPNPTEVKLKKQRRRSSQALIGALLVALAAIALAACGGGGSSGDSSSGNGGSTEASGGGSSSPTKMSIGMNSPTYSTQMTTYVAIDEGFFAEEGIEPVDVVTAENYVAGLVGGSLQITQGDTNTLLAAAQKDPDVVLLGAYRYKEFQELALAPGIENVDELKGKTVTGGERGSRNEAVVKQLLAKEGINEDEVNFVPFGGGSDDRLSALLAGKIQGTNLFPRHKKKLEEEGGKFVTEDLVSLPQESIATTKSYLEDHEEAVVAYWRAMLKARKFVHEEKNKERTLEISKDHKLEVTPEFEEVWPEEVVQISPDGGFEPAAMTKLVKEEQELELLPSDLEWKQYFDFKPLWQAQEEAGLKQNPDPKEVE
jgi:ABC-type nitrate/sulfonate/bicarbonate transport system substrate-binding protein